MEGELAYCMPRTSQHLVWSATYPKNPSLLSYPLFTRAVDSDVQYQIFPASRVPPDRSDGVTEWRVRLKPDWKRSTKLKGIDTSIKRILVVMKEPMGWDGMDGARDI